MKTLRQLSLKPVLIIIKINAAWRPRANNFNTGNYLRGMTPIANQNNLIISFSAGTLK